MAFLKMMKVLQYLFTLKSEVLYQYFILNPTEQELDWFSDSRDTHDSPISSMNV